LEIIYFGNYIFWKLYWKLYILEIILEIIYFGNYIGNYIFWGPWHTCPLGHVHGVMAVA